jgi:hypothetical protein
MTEIVKTKPQFQALSEEAILSALADPDPENPIALEVAHLIGGYTRNFQRHGNVDEALWRDRLGVETRRVRRSIGRYRRYNKRGIAVSAMQPSSTFP